MSHNIVTAPRDEKEKINSLIKIFLYDWFKLSKTQNFNNVAFFNS
jgi:hypothetical protein